MTEKATANCVKVFMAMLSSMTHKPHENIATFTIEVNTTTGIINLISLTENYAKINDHRTQAL